MSDEATTTGKSYLTPFNVIAGIIIVIGLFVTVMRFTKGLGAVTNLSDYNPWGIWIGFDVMAGGIRHKIARDVLRDVQDTPQVVAVEVSAQIGGIGIHIPGIGIGSAESGISAQDRHVVRYRERHVTAAGNDPRAVVRRIQAVCHTDRVSREGGGQAVLQRVIGQYPAAAVRGDNRERGVLIHLRRPCHEKCNSV